MDDTLVLFKALADRNRLRLVAALMQHGELCACQLTELLSVSGATASRHLSQLQVAGFVSSRKEGRWNYYRLNDVKENIFPFRWLRENLKNTEQYTRDKKELAAIVAEKPTDICRRQRGEHSDESLKSKGYLATEKIKILFLCTGNSCRSQMAEGWANMLKPDVLEAFSAGIETHGLNPYAVKVMAETGVDITSHSSQLIDVFDLEAFDYIITVCDHAYESCPIVPPQCRVIHKGFDDPPRLAEGLAAEEAILDCYRKVRDEIKTYIQTLPQALLDEGGYA